MTSSYLTHDDIAQFERAARAHRAAVLRSGFKATGRGVAAAWAALSAMMHRPTAA
ncbi:RSP_7527 family protein [Paroceanicella profunda]|uniref:RSP_7527 family protein n=1 Tax=Paroceanicella profunda TaxID=2579971 RepID=UPI00147942C6|nr:hypothetical protein [Paroceanicella profunda]